MSTQLFEHTFAAMGSRCSIHLYCESESLFEQASELCIDEMERLEAKYSRYRESSLVSQINDAAGTQHRIKLDEETQQLFHYAHVAYLESDGLFDITSGILRNVWDFKNPKVPSSSLIEKQLSRIGFEKIQLQDNSCLLAEKGMEIDFGGVVKEYAADFLAKTLKTKGVTNGLVNLAGDIHALGPHPDGSPWMVGISHPNQPKTAIANIPMVSGGLASSGDYQRCFILDGKKYCHILNPKTGWPVQGLAGVSVWAEQCIIAGTLATVAMLKGEADGLSWIKDLGVPFLAIDQNLQIEKQLS